MKLYPFVFSFHDVIPGKGFNAVVSMCGRVLLEENDDVWMFGVQPGSIAGGGAKREAAYVEFKRSYMSVLLDLVAESSSFDDFKKRVKAFFAQVNEPNAEQWDSALAEVRKQKISIPDVKTVQAETAKPIVKVEKVAPDNLTPSLGEMKIAKAA